MSREIKQLGNGLSKLKEDLIFAKERQQLNGQINFMSISTSLVGRLS